MRFAYAHSNNPSLFHANVGLTVHKFDQLYSEVSSKILSSSLSGYILEDKKVVGRPRAYSARSSLCLFLIHTRHYTINAKMCFDYGFTSEGTMMNYLDTLRSILFNWGEEQIKWPDFQTRINNGVNFTCDGSPKLRVTVVGDNSEQLWKGK